MKNCLLIALVVLLLSLTTNAHACWGWWCRHHHGHGANASPDKSAARPANQPNAASQQRPLRIDLRSISKFDREIEDLAKASRSQLAAKGQPVDARSLDASVSNLAATAHQPANMAEQIRNLAGLYQAQGSRVASDMAASQRKR